MVEIIVKSPLQCTFSLHRIVVVVVVVVVAAAAAAVSLNKKEKQLFQSFTSVFFCTFIFFYVH